MKQERKVESCKLVKGNSVIGCHWSNGLETEGRSHGNNLGEHSRQSSAKAYMCPEKNK